MDSRARGTAPNAWRTLARCRRDDSAEAPASANRDMEYLITLGPDLLGLPSDRISGIRRLWQESVERVQIALSAPKKFEPLGMPEYELRFRRRGFS